MLIVVDVCVSCMCMYMYIDTHLAEHQYCLESAVKAIEAICGIGIEYLLLLYCDIQ